MAILQDPEIAAVHGAINAWYKSGKTIDLFITMHTDSTQDFIYCLNIADSSQSYRDGQLPLLGILASSLRLNYVQEFANAPGDAVKNSTMNTRRYRILIEFAVFKSPVDPTIALYEQQGRNLFKAIHAYFKGKIFHSNCAYLLRISNFFF